MDKHPKDYPVPNFGVDHDIVTSNSNLKNAEKKLGPWTVPASLAEMPQDEDFSDDKFWAWGFESRIPNQ